MRALVLALALAIGGCSDSGGGSGGSGASGSGGSGGSAGSAGSSGGGGGSGDAAAGSSGCNAPEATSVDPLTAAQLVVSGDPGAALGIFDLAPVYPLGAPAGAISYSAVQAKNDIVTRIAVSADAGASWFHAAAANAASDVTVSTPPESPRCPGGSCAGRLIHEVSSLAFDPDDVPSRRWKLFAHSYVVLGAEELAYDWGYVALFVAPAPEGPWTFEHKAIGWMGEATISSEGASTLASDVPELADCVALTEPSALVLPGGTIQLALGCATLAQSIRIVLFESADHAQSFEYRGVLLGGDDALCVGGASPQYNAAHLFFSAGKQYLLASATAQVEGGFVGYGGCQLFELETVGGAAVRRTPQGDPIVLAAFDATGDRFNGACAYVEGATASGLLISILRLDAAPQIFRSYATGLSLP